MHDIVMRVSTRDIPHGELPAGHALRVDEATATRWIGLGIAQDAPAPEQPEQPADVAAADERTGDPAPSVAATPPADEISLDDAGLPDE